MENQKSAIGLDGNVAAALGYPIGIIALILIFIEKDNKFVRFHAIQSIIWGLFITIVMVVVMIVGGGIGFVAAQAVGSTIGLIFWGLTGLILAIVFFGWFILFIMAAVKAYGGQRYSLPVVGKFAEKWSS